MAKWSAASGAWALLLAAAFVTGMSARYVFDLVMSPTPYRDVQLVSVSHPDERTVVLIVDYIKTGADCTPKALIPFGITLGERKPLSYEPVRGPGQTGERLAGLQTMHLIIDLDGVQFDALSVMTRHDCGGRNVDREMIEVDIR